MSFVEIMQQYFRGERIEAAVFIAPAGAFLLAVAYAAYRDEVGGFRWGVAVPCAAFGLIFLAVGLTVAARTSGQIAAISEALEQSPARMLESELPRMQRVMRNFSTYLPVSGGLCGAGLLMRFILRASWAHGVGLSLVLAGAIALMIDGFAERRARPYMAALEALAHEHGVAPNR